MNTLTESPRSPSLPATPRAPKAPSDPGSPTVPASPGAPESPIGPVSPSCPGLPLIPGLPGAPGPPVAPLIPWWISISCTHFNYKWKAYCSILILWRPAKLHSSRNDGLLNQDIPNVVKELNWTELKIYLYSEFHQFTLVFMKAE